MTDTLDVCACVDDLGKDICGRAEDNVSVIIACIMNHCKNGVNDNHD